MTTRGQRLRAPSWRFFPVVGALLLAGALAEGLLANGGTLRLSDVALGGYRVSVFTDPTPVRPDTLDVSVLALRSADGSVAEGLDVRVRAELDGGDAPPRSVRATREEADDPRYYAAKFSLGAPGSWRITVSVDGPEGGGEASFDLRAREWGILANPLFVILISLVPLLLAGWWLLRAGDEAEGETEGVSPASRPGGS